MKDDENPFAKLELPPPGEPVDLDARRQAYLADALRRTAIAHYERDCLKGYPESDWSHPGLAESKAAIERVLAWEYGPKGMLLSGPTGRGKTRSLFGLYRKLACEQGRSVRYWFAGDWFSELQGYVRYGRDDARQWVEACASHPLVILDDLGQEAVTTARSDWAEAWFFRFLDIRISKSLPLLCSTNIGAEGIAAAFSSSKGIRANPLIRRLLDLADPVKF